MKRLLMTMFFFSCAFVVQAQTWEEWTEQKKTQVKYLLQQIAALKVYTGHIQKGYAIAKSGLNTINAIKKGDFHLHRDFFSSLQNVNPAIKNYAKVIDILSLQLQIVQIYKRVQKRCNESKLINRAELSYVNAVFTGLLGSCITLMDELSLLTTSGKIELKDDERIRRIDALHADMQDKYSFVQDFAQKVNTLQLQRLGEKKNIERTNSLYGLSQ